MIFRRAFHLNCIKLDLLVLSRLGLNYLGRERKRQFTLRTILYGFSTDQGIIHDTAWGPNDLSPFGVGENSKRIVLIRKLCGCVSKT